MNQPYEKPIALEDLTGKEAWGLVRTVGSMFFLEIGAPLFRLHTKRVHGEYHFLFQDCDWTFYRNGNVELTSSDDQAVIDLEFKRFDLKTVKTFELAGESHDLCITFTSGYQLQTSRPAMSDDQELWCLYGPRRSVLVADSSGRLVHEDVNKPSLSAPI